MMAINLQACTIIVLRVLLLLESHATADMSPMIIRDLVVQDCTRIRQTEWAEKEAASFTPNATADDARFAQVDPGLFTIKTSQDGAASFSHPQPSRMRYRETQARCAAECYELEACIGYCWRRASDTEGTAGTCRCYGDGIDKVERIQVGDKVERRDGTYPWGFGFVTQVEPLLVTLSTTDPSASKPWDEVRPFEPPEKPGASPDFCKAKIAHLHPDATRLYTFERLGKFEAPELEATQVDKPQAERTTPQLMLEERDLAGIAPSGEDSRRGIDDAVKRVAGEESPLEMPVGEYEQLQPAELGTTVRLEQDHLNDNALKPAEEGLGLVERQKQEQREHDERLDSSRDSIQKEEEQQLNNTQTESARDLERSLQLRDDLVQTRTMHMNALTAAHESAGSAVAELNSTRSDLEIRLQTVHESAEEVTERQNNLIRRIQRDEARIDSEKADLQRENLQLTQQREETRELYIQNLAVNKQRYEQYLADLEGILREGQAIELEVRESEEKDQRDREEARQKIADNLYRIKTLSEAKDEIHPYVGTLQEAVRYADIVRNVAGSWIGELKGLVQGRMSNLTQYMRELDTEHFTTFCDARSPLYERIMKQEVQLKEDNLWKQKAEADKTKAFKDENPQRMLDAEREIEKQQEKMDKSREILDGLRDRKAELDILNAPVVDRLGKELFGDTPTAKDNELRQTILRYVTTPPPVSPIDELQNKAQGKVAKERNEGVKGYQLAMEKIENMFKTDLLQLAAALTGHGHAE